MASCDVLGYQIYLNSFLYSGVTTVLDTGNVPPFILQLRATVASRTIKGPRIYCVGPLIDGPDPIWASISVAITSKYQIPSIVAQLKSDRVDLLKLYSGLSDRLVRGISAEGKKNNLRTIIDQGYRNGSIDLMDEGIAGFAHLPSREVSDDVINHAKDKSIFFISTLILGEQDTLSRLQDLRYLQDPLVADVTPPSQLQGLRELAQKSLASADQEHLRQSQLRFQGAESNVKRLWDIGVLLAAGTDAPYPVIFKAKDCITS
jgi:hypothetical protein